MSDPTKIQVEPNPIALQIKYDKTPSTFLDNFGPSFLVALVGAVASFGAGRCASESQAELARNNETLAKALDKSRQDFDRETTRIQRIDAEARELATYRRTQRAQLLLPLFKSLPGKDDDQTLVFTSKGMTEAYRQGAGLFLGTAAPVYHWTKDMLDQLATVSGAPQSDMKRASHRVVSTLRTALIVEVEGNDDDQWKAAAARTLQRVPLTLGIPSFTEMRSWRDGPRLLAYLLRADRSMDAVDTDGAWPTEK